MKYALCDDDPDELRIMADLLLQFNAQAEFSSYRSAQDLLNAFSIDYFDIVLLDIEMQEPNGYQIAQELSKLPEVPLIIFITQSSDYTIRGYEVAFRYLKKPVSYCDFERALMAATSKISPKRILINGNHGAVFLRVKDIIYIEVFSYIAIFHTEHGIYKEQRSLKQLEKEISISGFARPHNSYLVNLEYVDYIQKDTIILTTGEKLPLSRNRQKIFYKTMSAFMRR